MKEKKKDQLGEYNKNLCLTQCNIPSPSARITQKRIKKDVHAGHPKVRSSQGYVVVHAIILRDLSVLLLLNTFKELGVSCDVKTVEKSEEARSHGQNPEESQGQTLSWPRRMAMTEVSMEHGMAVDIVSVSVVVPVSIGRVSSGREEVAMAERGWSKAVSLVHGGSVGFLEGAHGISCSGGSGRTSVVCLGEVVGVDHQVV